MNGSVTCRAALPLYDVDSIAAQLATHAPPRDDLATNDGEASVALILRASTPGADAELLLIRRADNPRDPWSGHMAFPGGRRDAGDTSLLETAMRETREEVGLDLRGHARVLGRLPDVPAMARGRRIGMTIGAFVFAQESVHQTLAPNHEVAETIWAPLGPLARGEGASTFPYPREGAVLELPCLKVGDQVVWGLTYQMLQALFELLRR